MHTCLCWVLHSLFRFPPGPGSSVGIDAGCQSRGCEFESRLGQLSFRRLTKVNASFVFHQWANVYVEKQPVAWEECCVEYWCEKSRKCMSRWTGRRDITVTLFKTALNPIQSINQSINCLNFQYYYIS